MNRLSIASEPGGIDKPNEDWVAANPNLIGRGLVGFLGSSGQGLSAGLAGAGMAAILVNAVVIWSARARWWGFWLAVPG